MAGTQAPSPTSISKQEFDDLLAQYEPLLKSVSAAKPAKPGQKSLVELDQYRYFEAPEFLGVDKPARSMEHDDVKALVEWKLRHGKFRPTLMKLVSSNDSATVTQIIKDALQTYKETSDPSAAVEVFTKLKGIGPATASLLLSVHDAERVLFFSDEAYYWLCCGGKKESIKYNKKEYAALGESAKGLMGRLGVRAVDIEKVAYVVMNQTAGESSTKSEEKAAPERKAASRGKREPATREPEKKKRATDEDKKVVAASLRRSKRTRVG